MTSGKVLIAAPVHEVLLKGLTDEGYELVRAEKVTQETAFDVIGDCVGVVTSTRLQLDKELLDTAKKLRWIGRMGSGMEVIDVAYATEKGVRCFSSPEGNSNAVAEHAIGMLLSLTKRITWSHGEVKQGKWLRDENRGMELEGKTVGIIGYGNTGAAFARKLMGFDVRLLVYDKEPKEVPRHITNCEHLSMIQDEADIISFHVPLKPDTKRYFDRAFLERMKKPFILVNTSRGKVVDTKVLYEGLNAGKVIGACLDVLEKEPIDRLEAEEKAMIGAMMEGGKVVVTPHIAGYSHEALYKMSEIILKKIVMCS